VSARVSALVIAFGAALAATPAWAEEESPRDDPARAEPPNLFSFRAAVEGGAFTQRFLVLPVRGLEVSGALGVDYVGPSGFARGWELDLRLGYTSGDTPAGLSTRSYRLGPEVAMVLGSRVRLGIGVHLADVGYRRATNGDLADAFVWGGSAFLTVDLLPFDHHALYLGVRGNYDSDGSLLDVYDVGLTLGLRL
jgi:hypothetical protein